MWRCSVVITAARPSHGCRWWWWWWWWMVLLPAVKRAAAAASMTPAAVAGVPIAGRLRAIGVPTPRPLSARPDRRCPPAVTSAEEQARGARPLPSCWDDDCRVRRSPAATGRSRGHREWLSGVQLAADPGHWGSVRCPLLLPESRRVSGWWVSAADTAAACGVRRYRNRSPGWRPLDGCRHCRYARASCRWRRSQSRART
jgi:hypothetical protein